MSNATAPVKQGYQIPVRRILRLDDHTGPLSNRTVVIETSRSNNVSNNKKAKGL
jgi:hypothetical protein